MGKLEAVCRRAPQAAARALRDLNVRPPFFRTSPPGARWTALTGATTSTAGTMACSAWGRQKHEGIMSEWSDAQQFQQITHQTNAAQLPNRSWTP